MSFLLPLLLTSLIWPSTHAATIFTPTDWRLPALDFTPMGDIFIPKPDRRTTLNISWRQGGKIDHVGKKERNVASGARYYKHVMGDPPNYSSASGPCIHFEKYTHGSNRTGFWCSQDINCVLFYDDNCQYRINEKQMPSVVLQPPGIDHLNYGWWQEKSGLFMDYKVDGFVPGPKSARCQWRQGSQKGMNMDAAKETMVGIT